MPVYNLEVTRPNDSFKCFYALKMRSFIALFVSSVSLQYPRGCKAGKSLKPMHYGTKIGQIETKPLLLFNLVDFNPIELKLSTKVIHDPKNKKKYI